MQQGKSKLVLLQRQKGKLRLSASWWRFWMRTYWPPLASSLHVRVSPTKSDLRNKVAHQQAVQAGQGLPVCSDTPQLLLLPVAQVRTPHHMLNPKRLLPAQLLQVLLLCGWLPAQTHFGCWAFVMLPVSFPILRLKAPLLLNYSKSPVNANK